jgi:hypothetical protein
MYNALAGLSVTANLTGDTLGSGGTILTLVPGVYMFSTSAQLTGALTLDFTSNPNGVFVFQIGTTLTTASGPGDASVNVVDAGSNSAVYWDVGSSATLGTYTTFAGNILADQSIALQTDATIGCGRAIALNAAVTMDTNTISNDCTSSGFSGGPNGITPIPAALPLFAGGLGALGLLGWCRKRKNAAALAAA